MCREGHKTFVLEEWFSTGQDHQLSLSEIMNQVKKIKIKCLIYFNRKWWCLDCKQNRTQLSTCIHFIYTDFYSDILDILAVSWRIPHYLGRTSSVAPKNDYISLDKITPMYFLSRENQVKYCVST